MSDTTATAPQGATADTTTAPKPSDVAPATDATDWKAEARKWEARAKENSGAAAELEQIKESQKSEIQKALDRAEAAEQEAAKNAREKSRLAAVAAHQIPSEYQDLVRGDDEDELEASATKVAALIATAGSAPTPTRVVVTGEGSGPALPLNGDGLEAALRSKLNI